jgi:uncharacterized protein with PIN domain
MKYLCDQMLGTLAKWMRIYGLDTFYASNEMDDSELIEICKKEKRALITSDKDLIIRARRENLKTIVIKSIDINDQIRKIISDKEIDTKKLLSRCILCNSKVIDIKKTEVKEKVPERIYENNEKFWYCKNCNKIYWKGTHFKNMIKKINEIEKATEAS